LKDAPGQSILAVRGVHRVQNIDFATGTGSGDFLTGLAGRDILASRSPWMHEQEAAAQGIELRYTLFDFNDRQWDDAHLPQLLATAERDGFLGLNITFPFKQAVLPFLDDLSDAARRIGAVNTVRLVDGKRIGHNTDVSGFAESMRTGLPGAALDHVVQIGCGGAGSATAHALIECGVKTLTLFDRDADKQRSLVASLSEVFGADRVRGGADLASALMRADGLVNSTPMGMASYPESPVPVELIDVRHWVADIVYFPLETALLRDAGRKGCRTLNGSGMAVHQAAAAFDIFMGLHADRARMLTSFVEFVSASAIRTA
jgi:shikimate dehydrogenase